jgi:hypothetical protein
MSKMSLVLFATLVGATLIVGCARRPPAEAADTIYVGGDIVTVNDAQPTAEALAVKDGKILAVGTKDAVMETKGANTRVVDLAGKTLVPGFIDGHSHFIDALTMADYANVAQPPVGPANNSAEVVAELRKFGQAQGIAPGELLLGSGYDDRLMSDGKPVSRELLDKEFPDNPVIVVHTTKHGAVLNSAAFAKFGFKDGMPTPAGGVILRKPGTQDLQGLVMEMAYLPVFAGLPNPTPETELEAARKGQQIYAAAGITTAQEGATHAPQVEQLQRIGRQGGLYIDVIALPFVTDIDTILAANPASNWGKYENRLKLGGCKMTIDGSPQAKTAWFTTPYLTGGPNGEKNWTGGPSIPEDAMLKFAKTCYDNGLQMWMHGNGDASIDFLLKAHEASTGDDPVRDRGVVCIHCQFVRPDQLKKMKEYNITPALFTLHTYFFYDTHVVNRGPEQAGFISPMKSAIEMGMRPTNHTDYSVTPIDQMFTIWSAVNRISRDGVLNGPDQRITPLQALRSITIDSARAYGEETSKGSLEKGKLADIVILDRNPLTVEPMEIKDIKVVETIKEGKTIYPMQ